MIIILILTHQTFGSFSIRENRFCFLFRLFFNHPRAVRSGKVLQHMRGSATCFFIKIFILFNFNSAPGGISGWEFLSLSTFLNRRFFPDGGRG